MLKRKRVLFVAMTLGTLALAGPAWAGEKPSTETLPDGTKVTTNADGSKTSEYKDGTKYTQHKDGSKTIEEKDGTKTTYKPDGTRTTKKPGKKPKTDKPFISQTHKDGGKEFTYVDGTRVKFKGSGKFQVIAPGPGPTGRTKTEYRRDGSRTVKGKPSQSSYRTSLEGGLQDVGGMDVRGGSLVFGRAIGSDTAEELEDNWENDQDPEAASVVRDYRVNLGYQLTGRFDFNLRYSFAEGDGLGKWVPPDTAQGLQDQGYVTSSTRVGSEGERELVFDLTGLTPLQQRVVRGEGSIFDMTTSYLAEEDYLDGGIMTLDASLYTDEDGLASSDDFSVGRYSIINAFGGTSWERATYLGEGENNVFLHSWNFGQWVAGGG